MTTTKRRLVLRGLVAVNLLMIAVAVMASYERHSWGRWVISISLSTLYAQWSLLAIWTVLGSSRIVVRVASTLICCAVGAIGMSAAGTLSSQGFEFANFLEGALNLGRTVFIRVALVSGALMFMWLNGLSLVDFRGPLESTGSAWPRFSLRQLLVATAIVAVLLGAGNFVRSASKQFDNPAWLISTLLHTFCSLLITCVILMAALSPAAPAARVVLASVLAVLIAMVRAYARHGSDLLFMAYPLGAFLQALWLTGSLLVVRACGYRALWPSDWNWVAEHASQIELQPDAGMKG